MSREVVGHPPGGKKAAHDGRLFCVMMVGYFGTLFKSMPRALATPAP